MNSFLVRICCILSFTILSSCAPQESYVKPSAEASKDVASLDGVMDYTQFTAKIRIQWIKRKLNDYLFDIKNDPTLVKKRIEVFPFTEDENIGNDAKSLLCFQRLLEIRANAGKAYLKSVTSAISQKVEEPGQDIEKLLGELVKDSSINIAYEVPENPTMACASDLKDFYKTAYITSSTPESLSAAVEAGAALYGLLKEVVIALGQESVRVKNAVQLREFLASEETQKNIDAAIQSSKNLTIENSRIDRRYAVNRFKRAYLAMNDAVKEVNPTKLEKCKSFFGAVALGSDSPSFQMCADALYGKIEGKVTDTVSEASKYDIEADKDPTALVDKVAKDFGNLKDLANGNWKTSTYVDLVSSVVRVGRLADTVNKKLQSDEVKTSIANLVKELK